jgi:Fe-S-cluster containining protein
MRNPRDKTEQEILENTLRLGPGDCLKFRCHPGVSCFNKCCSDVNILLSPYDVLRMKQRVGMHSSEFLDKYTMLPINKEMKFPIVMLRLDDEKGKTCPFLGDQGCDIYEDRPWPCRMYPLGLAAQKDTPDGWQGERFYFLLKEDMCKGHDEPDEQQVGGWLEGQGIEEYDRWGEAFKEMTLHEYFEKDGVLSPEKMHMLYTACYDLDKFREFVFESTLLDRFDVDEDFVEEMHYDDEALLRLGFLWLRFSLFGEPTMKVKAEVAEAFKGSLDKKELFDQTPAEAANEKAR